MCLLPSPTGSRPRGVPYIQRHRFPNAVPFMLCTDSHPAASPWARGLTHQQRSVIRSGGGPWEQVGGRSRRAFQGPGVEGGALSKFSARFLSLWVPCPVSRGQTEGAHRLGGMQSSKGRSWCGSVDHTMPPTYTHDSLHSSLLFLLQTFIEIIIGANAIVRNNTGLGHAGQNVHTSKKGPSWGQARREMGRSRAGIGSSI